MIHRAKSRVVGKATFTLEAPGENIVSLPFLASRDCRNSLAHGLPIHLQSQKHSILKSTSLSLIPSLPPPLLLFSHLLGFF